MTVQELIEELSAYDPNTKVYVPDTTSKDHVEESNDINSFDYGIIIS